MMGPRQEAQAALFYEFSLEGHVPQDHLLRSIDRFVDLNSIHAHLTEFYSHTGRPSVDPELLMASTERAFAELTNGAYQKLLTQPDGEAEILLAVDSSGTAKQIGDMSKGTRFQLYLALRAAAYEQMVAQGIQLPFLCDDVFETFDEDRTRAACRLMERIGRSGQAIYLTHHRHVVEIAKDVCEQPPVIHNL